MPRPQPRGSAHHTLAAHARGEDECTGTLIILKVNRTEAHAHVAKPPRSTKRPAARPTGSKVYRYSITKGHVKRPGRRQRGVGQELVIKRRHSFIVVLHS